MSLRKNESIPLRPTRVLRIDFHYAEIKRDQQVHSPEWSADVTRPALGNGANSQPTSPSGQCFQLAVVFVCTHGFLFVCLFSVFVSSRTFLRPNGIRRSSLSCRRLLLLKTTWRSRSIERLGRFASR